MDQELKAYLDQAFSQIDGRLSGVEGRLGSLEGRLGSLEGRLGSLEGRLGSLEGRLDALEVRLTAVEEAVGQTRILVEGQRSDTRQVAEGVIGTNERLDSFREEMSLQFEHVRSLISPPYSDLNRRMKMLESWRERTERDPVELVRERFGRPKAT